MIPAGRSIVTATREIALGKAIESSSKDVAPETIVQRAEAFTKFLEGSDG